MIFSAAASIAFAYVQVFFVLFLGAFAIRRLGAWARS
jgi:hypothetical protein